MVKKLVVFEGVDNSGKTTVSKILAQKLEWSWNKEPRFSTEEADRLNSPEMKDEEARESLFMESRKEGLKDYEKDSHVVDRYTWSGVAYARVFSPSIVKKYDHVYAGSGEFRKPDAFIFLDTDLSLCLEREPEVGMDRLVKIRNAYMDSKHLFDGVPTLVLTVPKDSVPSPDALADMALAWLREQGVAHHE